VDNTEAISRLIDTGQYYFLSRPRRFGKSLLISTLKELFSGSRDLFRGLWIHDKLDWQEHPVIELSFNNLDYAEKGLKHVLDKELSDIASNHQIELANSGYADKFKELIKTLGAENKVVILIDEYDKPIIDYVDDLDQARENRAILKNFYSVIKNSDRYIRFLFITGVSKFSQVSIFSDLNNLIDLTLHPEAATLTGITHEELLSNFTEHIAHLQTKQGAYYSNIEQAIRDEYLGYSWNGQDFVYNPFTLLMLFHYNQFSDHWFRTGTPTFLMKLIKARNYSALDIEDRTITLTMLEKYDIEHLALLPLLFQTGYLTIKAYDPVDRFITLDYPNNEVARAFSLHLLSNMNGGDSDATDVLLTQMVRAFREDAIDKFLSLFRSLLKGIAYPIAEVHENYFHSIFYLVVKMLGFYIDCEVLTIDGRIDAVVQTSRALYIMEFKTGNTEKAIEQIRKKGYHEKYSADRRRKVLVGLDFDTEAKQLAGYDVQEL
jgi:hypothetical protein